MKQQLITFGLISIIVLMLFSCTKENPKFAEKEPLKAGTFRYTVAVLSAEDLSYKTTSGLANIIVSVLINDSVYVDTTDINGYAIFNNVPKTYIPVSIKSDDYFGAELLINLNISDSISGTEIVTNVTTKIALLPIKSEKSGKISGKTTAELDLTNNVSETAPSGIKVSARIPASSLQNFVEHQGFGYIEDVFYNKTTFFAETNSQGEYSLEIPAIPNGLKILLTADDFRYNQIQSNSQTIDKVFKAPVDTLIIYSDLSKISDIKYR